MPCIQAGGISQFYLADNSQVADFTIGEHVAQIAQTVLPESGSVRGDVAALSLSLTHLNLAIRKESL